MMKRFCIICRKENLVDDKTAGADGKKNISEKTDVEPLSALVLEKE